MLMPVGLWAGASAARPMPPSCWMPWSRPWPIAVPSRVEASSTTATLDGRDAEAYLRAMLTRIANHPMNRVADLLPWAMAT